MPKSLHSSLECPDTLADRLEGHRFGVAATATLALVAALVAGNMLSVRAEESMTHGAVATSLNLSKPMANSSTQETGPMLRAVEPDRGFPAQHAHDGFPANTSWSPEVRELAGTAPR